MTCLYGASLTGYEISTRAKQIFANELEQTTLQGGSDLFFCSLFILPGSLLCLPPLFSVDASRETTSLRLGLHVRCYFCDEFYLLIHVEMIQHSAIRYIFNDYSSSSSLTNMMSELKLTQRNLIPDHVLQNKTQLGKYQIPRRYTPTHLPALNNKCSQTVIFPKNCQSLKQPPT